MSEHDKEPWKWEERDREFGNMPALYNIDGQLILNLGDDEQYYPACGMEPNKANAKRIVDCVNAMSGIDNPAEFMAEIKEAFNCAKDVMESGDACCYCYTDKDKQNIICTKHKFLNIDAALFPETT